MNVQILEKAACHPGMLVAPFRPMSALSIDVKLELSVKIINSASAALPSVSGKPPAMSLLFGLTTLGFLLAGCGGSASESPYPLEPSSKKVASTEANAVPAAEGDSKTVR